MRYVEISRLGEHQIFSEEFLESQHRATTITASQLDQIKEHLGEVVVEVEAKVGRGTEDEEEQPENLVRIDLQEAFGHTRSWIARIRVVIMNSHIFYKINYALAADQKRNK